MLACFALPLSARDAVSSEAETWLDAARPAIPPDAQLGFEWHDSHDLQDGAGDAEWTVWELRSPLMVRRLEQGTTLQLGLEWTMADLDVSSDALSWSGQLHRLMVPVTFFHKPDGGSWFWLGQVAPGLRSDLESISGDDFAFRAFAVAMRPLGDSLALGLGAYVSYDVDGWFAVPGLGVTWKPAEDWLISLIPPELAATWLPSDDWVFQLSFRPKSFLADISADATGPDYASVKYGRLAATAKYRFAGRDGGLEWWLGATAGYTLYSEVELKRDGRSLLDGDLDQAPFAGVSLELRGW